MQIYIDSLKQKIEDLEKDHVSSIKRITELENEINKQAINEGKLQNQLLEQYDEIINLQKKVEGLENVNLKIKKELE